MWGRLSALCALVILTECGAERMLNSLQWPPNSNSTACQGWNPTWKAADVPAAQPCGSERKVMFAWASAGNRSNASVDCCTASTNTTLSFCSAVWPSPADVSQTGGLSPEQFGRCQEFHAQAAQQKYKQLLEELHNETKAMCNNTHDCPTTNQSNVSRANSSVGNATIDYPHIPSIIQRLKVMDSSDTTFLGSVTMAAACGYSCTGEASTFPDGTESAPCVQMDQSGPYEGRTLKRYGNGSTSELVCPCPDGYDVNAPTSGLTSEQSRLKNICPKGSTPASTERCMLTQPQQDASSTVRRTPSLHHHHHHCRHHQHLKEQQNHHQHLKDQQNHHQHLKDQQNHHQHLKEQQNHHQHLKDQQNHHQHLKDQQNHHQHLKDQQGVKSWAKWAFRKGRPQREPFGVHHSWQVATVSFTLQ